ncbi:predicted protein [Uncinocarpus reesii 1704]|uniref:Inositol polyphosphate-related phosphatase domain-containing protein n=1 Tax=Uncinocarpus reesii (strain UAMH 1704) TaxID=336963 RepID=C4JN24_UNCRE|nr:uncharacterized protein UREG_04232 [Uncinocarpus reesii 1704]EEP79386.1 predicted protein [Uncinocarpus reesii 1704]
MSIHETTTPSDLRDAPGAFPDQQDDREDAQVASDFNSLSRAVYARRAEYVRRKTVRVRIGSWNVAALPGTEEDLAKWFMKPARGKENNHKGHKSHRSESGIDDKREGADCKQQDDESLVAEDESIDIYVLGLQEIVDVNSPAETLRPYVDPAPSTRWKEAVQNALPDRYTLVSSQQLTGLLLLVYASQSTARTISSVSSLGIGTGLMGYMGNKGAVATRIVIGGITRIVFVNCHLAAGADKASLDRRNWDASQVVMRAKFDPIDEGDDLDHTSNQTLGEEDFAFWFGDLNYRLDDIPGDDVRRLLHLHTENDFGPLPKPATRNNEDRGSQTSNRSSMEEGPPCESPGEAISMVDNDLELDQDPASLETTLTSLLPHDQLHAQQRKRNAFYEGWREAEITFLPTYKYDIGRIGKFDSSEKQRSPSWCDRILYRTRQDYLEYKRRTKEAEDVRKRDDEMKSLGLDQEAEDASVLFDYDPEFDGAYDENEDADDNAFTDPPSIGEYEDLLSVSCYTSHQGIVSSDHKPLHADFILTYDSVIQELKAKVHQEVARELDKAENEARPDITVVVDVPVEKAGDTQQASNGTTDRDTVNFGQIRYDVPVSRSLTLANTGSVPATFSFQYRPVAADEESRVSPPWLHLRVDWPANGDTQAPNTHKEYTLPPGESAHVHLVLCIFDMDFVRELNTGKAKVDDVLVLRISNGRDHFLSVRGQWLLSCFGLSLEEFTRIPEGGIRRLEISSFMPYLSGSERNDNVRTSAPRELFRLTEALAELVERSLAEWDMVGNSDEPDEDARPWASERAGWPFDSETWSLKNSRERYKLLGLIREALDTSTPFFAHFPPEIPSRHRAELLSETLISFLRSLHDGVITKALWSELESQIPLHEKPRPAPLITEQAQSRVLEAISTSPAHSVSFTFLTFMLNRIAGEVAPLGTSTTSMPLSPATPSVASHGRASTDLSEPSSPSVSTSTRSSITFPFRFKSRSRTLSSSDGNDAPMINSRPPTSNAPSNAHTATLARRQAVYKAFVGIFVDVIFSKDIAVPEKDKEKRAFEERKRSILEPFLRSDGDS